MNQGPQSYSPQKMESKKDSFRVLVGLSGGIHSAVTAALLKTQGHEVIGIFLDLGVPAALELVENHCSGGNARADAEKAAAALGIELHVVDASELYEVRVIEHLVHERSIGHAPNPCVPCNREVRLTALFQKAAELRCDKVATGHGAQLLHDPRTGTYQLLQAGDPARDQSFFLFTLTQEELSKLMLPLGNFPHAMVGRLGEEYGFSPASSFSQGVCFSSAQGTASFIEGHLAPSLMPKGVIRTVDARVLGEHRGIHRFCHGDSVQVDLLTNENENLVVVDMDLPNHALILGDPKYLLKKECIISRTHWLKAAHRLKGLRCYGRLTPNGAMLACQLTFFENQTAHVEFDESQGPLFPGQAIVFYQDNEVLGGGWIRTTS